MRSNRTPLEECLNYGPDNIIFQPLIYWQFIIGNEAWVQFKFWIFYGTVLPTLDRFCSSHFSCEASGRGFCPALWASK